MGTLDKSDVSIKTCLSLKLTLDVGMFIFLLVAKFRLGQSNSFSLRAKVPQLSLPGTKVLRRFCSRERTFHIIFAPGSESSKTFLLPGTKVPYLELSFPGAKVLESESSIIRIYAHQEQGLHNVTPFTPEVDRPTSRLVFAVANALFLVTTSHRYGKRESKRASIKRYAKQSFWVEDGSEAENLVSGRKVVSGSQKTRRASWSSQELRECWIKLVSGSNPQVSPWHALD